MKNYLERIAFTAALGALAAVGWIAVETEASSTARPVLVEAAVAAVVDPTEPPPTVELEVSQRRAVVSAPATVITSEEQSLLSEQPRAERVDAVPVATASADTASALAAPSAAGDEELATTSSDDASHGSIVVEHTIAAIPDPPDVGASDRRRAFEVEADDDGHDPWSGVRNCESHNNYSINTGNGFYGAYQFTISTWDWVAELIGRPDLIGVRPDLAAPWDQDRLAQALAFEVAGGGLQHWPVCGRFYG